MKRITIIIVCFCIFTFSCSNKKPQDIVGMEVQISKDVLKDKIKGGWAGQTIGCTYGGPTEFKYRGALIHDDQNLIWYDDYAKETFEEDPGLYDDVYMDLTFMEVLEKCGLDAPTDSFAIAFANADYKLWHANQAARYNILHGIMPPASGHWMNNPHADDIDFQIEADFAGLMSPGMANVAADYCDRIGHIMNYGDGWYGGLYMATMYSLAFVSNDMNYIVSKSLTAIPKNSKFRNCIEDVIKLYREDPKDWKKCWFEIEQKHAFEVGCPEGVFNAFNIDATLNAAYVVMGLLYGEGDFFKTMDIATRVGQDSDCNPATAAGILGVMIGYSNIPQFWKPAIEKVEDMDFPYTKISLNKAYEISYKHALELIERNGGKVLDSYIQVKVQEPQVARWEQSFEGHYPSERRVINKEFYKDNLTIDFEGNGIVVMGSIKKVCGGLYGPYIAKGKVYLDGELIEELDMPFDYIKRKYDIFYKYQLEPKKHQLKIVWTNPNPEYRMLVKDVVIYSNKLPKKFKPE